MPSLRPLLLHCLLASVLWEAPASAQGGETSPLDRMKTAYASRRTVIEADAKPGLDAAREEFLKNLSAVEAKATEKGDLDGVLACREEAVRVRGGGGPPGSLLQKWSPPYDLPLDTFEGGTYYYETRHRSIYGGEAGAVTRQSFHASEGLYRFTVRAFQAAAGREEVRAVFRVGGFHQVPFSIPQTSRNDPGVFAFVCHVPAGNHPVEVEFLNSYMDPPSATGGARARKLILLGVSVETPGPRVVSSLRYAPLAEIQEAWAQVAGKVVAEQEKALLELGTKYLESLEALHAHLTRQGKPADAALVLSEVIRARELHPGLPGRPLPAGAVAEEKKDPPGGPALRFALKKVENDATPPDGASAPLLRAREGAYFRSIPNGGGFLACDTGPSAHLALPADPALELDGSSFSIAFMVQNLLPGNGLLGYKAGGNNNASGLAVGYEGGEMVFTLAGERLAARPTDDACAWRHFICVYNSADETQTLYLNGARIASRKTARSLNGTNASEMLVGAGSPDGKPGWQGVLSHFFVAGKALGATEAARLHALDRADLDNTLRAWRGPQPPKNVAEMQRILIGTTWSFRYDDRLSRKPVSLIMTFESAENVRLSDGRFFLWKATSARGIDLLASDGNRELRVLFDPEMKKFSANAGGIGGGNFGSRIRGNFWAR